MIMEVYQVCTAHPQLKQTRVPEAKSQLLLYYTEEFYKSFTTLVIGHYRPIKPSYSVGKYYIYYLCIMFFVSIYRSSLTAVER
jgi:hypothetical protein